MIEGLLVDEVNFIGRRASDGLRLISVTSAIKNAGFIPDMTYVNEHALLVGQAVHKAIRFYEAGTLDWDSIVDPQIAGRVIAWQNFKKETGCVTKFSEQPVWNAVFCYWGFLDWAGEFNGDPAIIDFKCGAVGDWVRYQTAGYAGCLMSGEISENTKKTPRRFGLQLNPDGSYNLSKEFKDMSDFRCFQSMASLMWEKINRGYLKQKGDENGNANGSGQTGRGQMATGRAGCDLKSQGAYSGFEGFHIP